MAMNLGQSLDANPSNIKRQKRYMRCRGDRIGFDDTEASYLIVKLPDSKILTLLARSVILACIIVSIPWFKLVLEKSVINSGNGPVSGVDRSRSEKLSTVFRDLSNEGLLKEGDKALLLSNGYAGDVSVFRSDDEVEMDRNRQSSIKGDNAFDLIVTNGYNTAAEFGDKILKKGGILASHLGEGPLEMIEIPTNYRTVYYRKSGSPIVAMRKPEALEETGVLGGRRRLLGFESKEEKKKAALQKLEDVLLEPPRSASGRSKSYLKKTRYLPDLMGDSLEGYPRRVFIDVGTSTKDEGDRSTTWFARTYPTRNLEFEIYRIETVAEDQDNSGKGAGAAAQTGMSDWLRKNVKEEEYVVMRAEAEVVEEIVKSKAIEMVDELFLDCKPRRCRRAYWECLALYGRLRDEGVAVHQWWG